MSNIFFISDTHFGHQKIIEGFGEGSFHGENSVRSFNTIEEHDETIVKNWNSVVSENDIVWHLGDVAVGGDLSDRVIGLLRSLKGKKYLTPGNHCTHNKIQTYATIFDKIVASHEFRGSIIIQHIPVHPREVETRFKANIHGHLHSDIITRNNGEVDTRYVNVSCEQIGMTPIAYDVIRDRLRQNGVF